MPDERFELVASSRVVVTSDDPDVEAVAARFGAWVRRSTGYPVPLTRGADGGDSDLAGDIVVAVDGSGDLGREGYRLSVTSESVRLTAGTAEGAFRGLTTVRLVFPPEVEAATVQPGPWVLAGAAIADAPRFAYRGAMLDVARHFFDVGDVQRYLELLSLLKINVLHLHLTDDQGWRLPVAGWPLLTEVGGASDVEGGAGGAYSEADIAAIVADAADRFITIVPEVDMPGHSTAALLAYPELTCDGAAPPPFQHIGISDASLCVGTPATDRFVRAIVASLVTQFPGDLVHFGGDEAQDTDPGDFGAFVPWAAGVIEAAGRRAMMWHEAAAAELPAATVVQYWGTADREAAHALARRAAERGHPLVLSPGDRVYLDMKYDKSTELGLRWAGVTPVSASYDWDPATLIDGVPEDAVLGVEGPLWTETAATTADLDHLAFPRIASVAEIGWSPGERRSWDDFRVRLAVLGARWDVLGVAYFRSPEIPWDT